MVKNYKETIKESKKLLLKNNNPSFRKKGYQSFLSDSKISKIDELALITEALSVDNIKNLTESDKLICDQINNAYLKKLKNINLEKENFF